MPRGARKYIYIESNELFCMHIFTNMYFKIESRSIICLKIQRESSSKPIFFCKCKVICLKRKKSRKVPIGLQGKELLHHRQCHPWSIDLCRSAEAHASRELVCLHTLGRFAAPPQHLSSYFSSFSPPPWDAELGRYMRWLFPAPYYQSLSAPCLFHHSSIARLLLQ